MPSARVRLSGSSERMPAFCAKSMTTCGVSASMRRTETVFFDLVSAARMVIGPSKPPFSKFCGFQVLPVHGSRTASGASLTMVTGVNFPLASAAP